ncbi:hypothetical protein N7539_004842, partial [Penicillium diatomitis]
VVAAAVVVVAACSPSLVDATAAGHFDKISGCADPWGMKKCSEKTERGFENCIIGNCSADGKNCYDSCQGDVFCMAKTCPSVGVECINACGCVKATDQIDCTASTCWNQVTQDVMNFCLGFDMASLPFWPPPSDAPGGCSCNIWNVTRQETLITSHLDRCRNDQNSIDRLDTDEKKKDYKQACTCCAESAIISTIWTACPNTKPSEIGADSWYDSFLKPHGWDKCASYLERHDCADELGFSVDSAGGTKYFYQPGKLPQNGTQTLFNTGESLSTPASGATFCWTDGSLIHTITAASFRASAPATTSDSDGHTRTGSAVLASATKSGGAIRDRSSSWLGVGIAGTVVLVFS